MKSAKPSFRSQLRAVAPNLLRHNVNGTYFGYKRSGKKRLTKSLDTIDRKTANASLRDWINELSAVDPSNTDMTLAMLLDRYEKARTGLSASTRCGEAGRIAKFRASFPLPMDALACRADTGHMAEWLAKVSEGKRAATANAYRAFVRALFDFAVSVRAIPSNPFDPKLCRKAKKQRVIRLIPSEAEFQAIIAEIRKPKWKPVKGRRGGQLPMFQHESADFAEFLGLAGVGQAEAVGLNWEDIDFAAGQIHYLRKKTKTDFKTPIYAWLKPLLQRLRVEGSGSGPVFKIRNVKKALTAACKRLGFPHFTQRNLRAMRIKRLWEAGVDVKIIAQLQGHRDGGSLIMTTYTEVFGSTSESYARDQLAKAERMFAAPNTLVPVKKKAR